MAYKITNVSSKKLDLYYKWDYNYINKMILMINIQYGGKSEY